MGDVTTIIGDSGTVLLEGVRYGGRTNTGVVKTEDATFKNKVTSNPVETGSDINDHIFDETDTFSIAATVIDGTCRDLLLSMRNNHDLLQYRGVHSFDDLVITSLKMSPQPSNETGFELSMSFQKINFVTAQKVKIRASMAKADSVTPKSKKTNQGGGKSKKNKGTQNTQTASVAVKEYNSVVSDKVNKKLGK